MSNGEENNLLNLTSLDGEKLEEKAKETATFLDLKKNLQKIRNILGNNPSQEEIRKSEIFLNSLTELKGAYEKSQNGITNETRSELGKLCDELEIYLETKKLLDKLNSNNNTTKKTEAFVTNPELNNNTSETYKGDYEKVFEDVKSDMILKGKELISQIVDSKFENLSPKQRDNIKLGIIGSIIEEKIIDSLIGGASSGLKSFGEIISNGDWQKLFGAFEDTKEEISNSDKESNLINKFITIVENKVLLVENFVKSNKENLNLANFLNNPSNIASLKPTSNIEDFKDSEFYEGLFAIKIKKEINSYDEKLKIMESVKNNLLDQVGGMPDFVKNGITAFIVFLCGIPVIGDFIKSFLDLEGSTKEEIKALTEEEINNRQSVNFLKSYGIRKPDESGVEPNTPQKEIPLFKNKDLSTIDYTKMKPCFKAFKDNGINSLEDGFWYNFFVDKKVPAEVNGKKIVVLINIEIGADDFDSSGKIKGSFYEKLNNISIIPETSKTEINGNNEQATVKPKSEAQEGQGITQTGSVVVPEVQQAPDQKETKDVLLSSIEYDNTDKNIIKINGQEYNVRLLNDSGTDYMWAIKKITLLNGEIILSSKIDGENEVISKKISDKLFLDLIKKGKAIYNADNKRVGKLECTITKIV